MNNEGTKVLLLEFIMTIVKNHKNLALKTSNLSHAAACLYILVHLGLFHKEFVIVMRLKSRFGPLYLGSLIIFTVLNDLECLLVVSGHYQIVYF